MPVDTSVATMLVDYGALALFVVLYIMLIKWVLAHFDKERAEYQQIIKDSAEREKNYQAIIAKLSDELPDMRETLARIEAKIT